MMDHINTAFDVKQVNDSGEFSGYASIFGNVDLGGDIVEPGAFAATLEKFRETGKMPKMLWQHEPSKVAGVWLDMHEDAKGLFARGKLLTEIQIGKEALVMLKNGALDGLSIGYQTVESEFDSPDSRIRRLTKLNLFEVSLVTFPMNPEANVTAVKRLEAIGDVERILRDAGVPNTFAKLVAAHGFLEAKKRIERGQREADEQVQNQGLHVATLKTTLEKLRSNLNG